MIASWGPPKQEPGSDVFETILSFEVYRRGLHELDWKSVAILTS